MHAILHLASPSSGELSPAYHASRAHFNGTSIVLLCCVSSSSDHSRLALPPSRICVVPWRVLRRIVSRLECRLRKIQPVRNRILQPELFNWYQDLQINNRYHLDDLIRKSWSRRSLCYS
jgi:hypothetical protein